MATPHSNPVGPIAEAGRPIRNALSRSSLGPKFQGVLTANRRATSSMLCSVRDSIGASTMDIISLAVLICSVYSIFLAGRLAERRGRRFKTWAGIAAVIGPFALPLLFLFPNL